MSNRVVITGAGILSPIGIGIDEFWSAISELRSGLSEVSRLAATALPGNVAGELKELTDKSARKYLTKPQKKSKKVMCREILLGVISANLCIDQSGLDVETPDAIDHERLGIAFGANQMFSPPEVLGEGVYAKDDDENLAVCTDDGRFLFDQWGEYGLRRMDPLWLLKYLPNMPACHIGIRAEARGPNNSLTLAEASGNSALGEAFRIIARGRADMMLCGSTGSRIHAVKCLHAALSEQLAEYDDDPATWCRPFDSTRKGQVVGEGACTFLFEEETHARSRGADILGTVLGAGSSCVLGMDGVPDHRRALSNAMNSALRDADISPSEIGHINAHGLGEQQTDLAEAHAIRDVFGAAADTVAVTAAKSYLGNSGAACGTLELAASLCGLKQGVVPATISCHSPDEACGLNIVRGEALPIQNKTVLNVNVTANGQAAALVVCGA